MGHLEGWNHYSILTSQVICLPGWMTGVLFIACGLPSNIANFVFLLKQHELIYFLFCWAANCSAWSLIFLGIWCEVVSKWQYLSLCRSETSFLCTQFSKSSFSFFIYFFVSLVYRGFYFLSIVYRGFYELKNTYPLLKTFLKFSIYESSLCIIVQVIILWFTSLTMLVLHL